VQNEYKNGKLNGLSQQFDRRGKRIQSSVYKNGRLDGPMRLYNEKGKLTKEVMFKNGQRVSNELNFRP
jgi:antitoxin component YwqK of YwqJK toxin-antitoxin module